MLTYHVVSGCNWAKVRDVDAKHLFVDVPMADRQVRIVIQEELRNTHLC